MDLKDIFILLLVIFIFGTVIFGSLGSFFSNVNTAVADVAECVAGEEYFTVDFLQENARSISENSHLDRDFAGHSVSGRDSSGGDASVKSSFGKNNYGSESSAKDSSNKNNSGNDFSFIDNIPFIDILHPLGSSETTYEDYQIDKDTDMVDSEGNPIYLSVVSTSGGQMAPGIYEVYWSELGIINQTRIK